MPFPPAFLPSPPASQNLPSRSTPRCASAPPPPPPPTPSHHPKQSPPQPSNKRRLRPTQYTNLILRHAQSGDLPAMQNAIRSAVSKGFVLNAVNYTTIANAHANHGDPKKVFEILGRMREAHVAPTRVTIKVAVKACERWQGAGGVSNMVEMLTWAAERGVGCDDVQVWNLAIRALVRKGGLAKAVDVFRWMKQGGRVGKVPKANVWSYNICLNALGQLGKFVDAVTLFGEMVWRGVGVDVVTYNTILEVAVSVERFLFPAEQEKSEERWACTPALFVGAIVDSMDRQGVVPDVTTETMILRVLARHHAVPPEPAFIWGRLWKVLDSGQGGRRRADKKYFDAVITAFGHAMDMDGVAFAFSRMLARRLSPDGHTVRALLVAAHHCGDVTLATKILDVSYCYGLQADQYFYTSAIASCAKSAPRNPEVANRLLTQALERGTKWTPPMINAAISTYYDDVSQALELWKKLRTCPDEQSRNVLKERSIYEALMRVCGRGARPDIALRIFYAARKAEHIMANSVDSRTVYSAFRRGVFESDGEKKISSNAFKKQYVMHLKAECGVHDWNNMPLERIRIKF